jgi:type VI protein secretion system component VasK
MDKIYDYVRHPRAAELALKGPTKTVDLRKVNHQNPFVRFNARFGLKITLIVGTMWAAYIFTVLALFALPDAIKQGTYFVVVWLSSSFLQLVLLPIIIVGQNIQAAAADKRAEDTYKDAEAVLKEAEEIQKHLLAQDEAISALLDRVEKLSAASPGPAPATGL